MSPFVKQAKLRNAFSRTARGSEISRKAGDCGCSLTNWPGGRSVDLIWRRSPGSSNSVFMSWARYMSAANALADKYRF